MNTAQLELNLHDRPDVRDGHMVYNGARGGDDDLMTQVRALVAEPDMSDDEIQALVQDALEMRWSAETRGAQLRR